MDIYHYLLGAYGLVMTICYGIASSKRSHWYRKYHEGFNEEIDVKLNNIAKFIAIYDHHVKKGLKTARYNIFKSQLIKSLPVEVQRLARAVMDDSE